MKSAFYLLLLCMVGSFVGCSKYEQQVDLNPIPKDLLRTVESEDGDKVTVAPFEVEYPAIQFEFISDGDTGGEVRYIYV